jgi:NAD(P)-dependent dehydrogenase (short-subunit alcohol dehydrogenase family)
MVTNNGNLVENVVQGLRQATESNLKMQQDLLQSWTRFWPGFTGRPVVDAKPSENRLLSPWFEGFVRAIEVQREFLNQQYDASLAALNAVGDIGPIDADPAAVVQPPVATTSKEPVKAEVPSLKKEVPVEKNGALPEGKDFPVYSANAMKKIRNKVALVTGAASGIGEAVSKELAARGAKAVLLVDRSEAVNDLAKSINERLGRTVAIPQIGDTTDEAFRKRVFNEAEEKYGLVTICVPAAGITRDALSVVINKESGKAELYPTETFRQVTEVNLIAPIYWAIEMVGRIAQDRRERGLKRWEPEEKIQGVVVFLGSVSSQGNKGQISYAVAKAGLEGAAATLTKEAIFHGVRCGIIHPGFTDTPMARALGQDFLDKYVLPYTQLRRLIRSEEIADAICFMINNSAVSGQLWADAGWHGPA